MTSTPPNPFGPADPVNPDGSPGPDEDTEEDADAAESSVPEDETERVIEDVEKYRE